MIFAGPKTDCVLSAYSSPAKTFLAETKGNTSTPAESQTYVTDAGPFGTIDNNDYLNNTAYEQVQWLKKDLASVNRTKTPWIFAMGHRPMYSSEVSSYQQHLRAAFEQILIDGGVDAWFCGHVHCELSSMLALELLAG